MVFVENPLQGIRLIGWRCHRVLLVRAVSPIILAMRYNYSILSRVNKLYSFINSNMTYNDE